MNLVVFCILYSLLCHWIFYSSFIDDDITLFATTAPSCVIRSMVSVDREKAVLRFVNNQWRCDGFFHCFELRIGRNFFWIFLKANSIIVFKIYRIQLISNHVHLENKFQRFIRSESCKVRLLNKVWVLNDFIDSQ